MKSSVRRTSLHGVSEIATKDKVSKKKPKVKKYDEVDIAQMSLFDTVKDDDVLEELKKSGRGKYDAHRCAQHDLSSAE